MMLPDVGFPHAYRLWELRTGGVDVINSPQRQGSDHYLSYVEFNLPEVPTA